MVVIDLSREIDNEEGYVDQIIYEIRNAQGHPLQMNITCIGGDVFQGARIIHEILQHDHKTKAVVIGVAASMGGVILSAFDEVILDKDSEIMLHKARIPDSEEEGYSKDQVEMIEKFNKKAYNRLLKSGVNEEMLNKVFLSDSEDDYWMTAKEAEQAGLGKAVELSREEGKAVYKMVAQLKSEGIKNSHYNYKRKKMKLFTKPVARLIALHGGEQITFSSKEEKLQKGDKVTMIGSEKVMNGDYRINDKLVASIEEGVVNEIKEEEVSPEEVSLEDVMSAIKDISDRVKALEEGKGGEEDSAEMKAKSEEEMKNLKAETEKVEEMKAEVEEKVEAVNTLVDKIFALSKTITGKVTPPVKNSSQEKVLSGLTEEEERIAGMRNILNNTVEQKEKTK